MPPRRSTRAADDADGDAEGDVAAAGNAPPDNKRKRARVAGAAAGHSTSAGRAAGAGPASSQSVCYDDAFWFDLEDEDTAWIVGGVCKQAAAYEPGKFALTHHLVMQLARLVASTLVRMGQIRVSLGLAGGQPDEVKMSSVLKVLLENGGSVYKFASSTASNPTVPAQIMMLSPPVRRAPPGLQSGHNETLVASHVQVAGYMLSEWIEKACRRAWVAASAKVKKAHKEERKDAPVIEVDVQHAVEGFDRDKSMSNVFAQLAAPARLTQPSEFFSVPLPEEAMPPK
eukprot:m.498221 g.498221  ORF g.498221 m.498221 type:complete len:285 (-) comp53538_c0_seq1:36-890(-)